VASERALVDAGPLVALLSARDAAHEACTRVIGGLSLPLVTSWAVLAEAAWLLRRTHNGLPGLMRLVTEGVITCPPLDGAAASWILDCERHYADLRPQLADLTLVYLAQQQQLDIVFTLDRRDFLVLRTEENRPFRLVPENVP
jgi:uncharacterized protein